MNWEAIGAIGEVAGAIAVVVTLAYLAIQIRQNTASMDESRNVEVGRAVQARTQQRFELQRSILESEHLMAAYAKLRVADWPMSRDILNGLSDLEREAYFSWSRMQIIIIENIYFQRQLGLVDEELYQNVVPAIRRWGNLWKEVGPLDTFRPSFISEVERILDAEPDTEHRRRDAAADA